MSLLRRCGPKLWLMIVNVTKIGYILKSNGSHHFQNYLDSVLNINEPICITSQVEALPTTPPGLSCKSNASRRQMTCSHALRQFPHNGRSPIHDDPADVVHPRPLPLAYKLIPRIFCPWSSGIVQLTATTQHTVRSCAIFIYSCQSRIGTMFRRSAARFAIAAAKAAEPSAHTLAVSQAQGVAKGLTGGMCHSNAFTCGRI